MKKVAELPVTKGTRNLFGWLIVLTATNGTDSESVFSFLILPESACFAYPDGTIRQNDKSTIFNLKFLIFNKDFQSNPPDTMKQICSF